jgi:mRNA-degrading endonuclease RelE of RelBE toxin-antitoxin system
MANSSRNIGKSGGFRVITYFIDENNVVYLVEIYDKSSIESISVQELKDVLDREEI